LEGELNRLVDRLLHKPAKKRPALWLVDFALHCLIERDLKKSVRKALRYYAR